MNAQGSQVWAVVVLYNGLAWAERCFGSLTRSSMKPHVLAIDNGSTDGTVEFVRERFPDVQVIEAGINMGFGRANNEGMMRALAAGGDFVFLLNQDAWVLPETLTSLMEAARQDRTFGILSPMHLNGAGDALDYNFSCSIGPENCAGLVSDLALGKVRKSVYALPFVNAAGWLMTKACIETVGGFDPLFFHYGEDDNYAARVRFHGLGIGVVPAAIIHHDRERRGSNPYFDEPRVWKVRRTKLRFADPAGDADPRAERSKFRRRLLRAMLTIDLWSARVARDQLRLLDEAQADKACEHRALARSGGAVFLDSHEGAVDRR